MQGKAGLAEATSSQTVSTASLTAPRGCNGKKKKFMVPWICVHMGRELSSTFFIIIIITGMF